MTANEQPTGELVLRASGLTKRFGRRTALEPLDFELRSGEFLGLLGVNGSGKSTLVKMLAGLVSPSAGHLEVLGERPGPRTKLGVAYLPEVDHLYLSWRSADAYAFLERFFPMNRARFAGLLDFLHVDPRARFGTLSKGNRTRVRLALTLAREARLYLLDEPLSGIDPLTREQILRALMGAFPAGAGVVLATHQVGEAENLFDRVLVLDGGRVLLSGGAEDIRRARGSSIDRAVKDAAWARQQERDGTRGTAQNPRPGMAPENPERAEDTAGGNPPEESAGEENERTGRQE
ncbi:ABC transporter ATP-binding protein [Deinococcus peraridilitoris]|uniref:ABC-type multidrug transport system, ATPase component n=1 Tax=Deinococcus peraridilitoris (strain DSM 19664 / LMG 22246 / CIP 109416 / KR-200) TaxID=937777 RepID=L0A1B0_DEIPD|nr:ABC transporter ATP-binding protein [Deinococcus peraridilitoris]AFZ66805.1 ABC-type multidrug transport system, ATPase component [Deinococcus peraridilitoris DSM 19664]